MTFVLGFLSELPFGVGESFVQPFTIVSTAAKAFSPLMKVNNAFLQFRKVTFVVGS